MCVKKMPVLNRAVGKAGTPQQPGPPMEAAGAQLLCDPWAGPGMAPAVGQKQHTKSLGVPTGYTLFSSWALFLPWLQFLPCLCLLTWSNSATMMCFPACWKKAILSSWDFHRDATIFLKSSFSIYFLYFEILTLLNAANALLPPYMET